MKGLNSKYLIMTAMMLMCFSLGVRAQGFIGMTVYELEPFTEGRFEQAIARVKAALDEAGNTPSATSSGVSFRPLANEKTLSKSVALTSR